MRALIQRVLHAQVQVDNTIVGSINNGLLVFLGIHKEDKVETIPWMVQKIYNLRIFSDEQGKMNRSMADLKKDCLIVSQFTLYGNCTQSRRPDFFDAAPPAIALDLYRQFIEEFKKLPIKVESGEFGAHMKVSLVNDGPVTLLIEKEKSSL